METMKKFLTLVSAIGLVLYLSSTVTYAAPEAQTKARPAPNRPQVERREDRRDTRNDERKDTRQDTREDQRDVAPGNDAREDRRDVRQDERKDVRQDARKDTRQAERDAEFVNRIESNPQLKGRVQALLPSGTVLKTAASGFQSQAQFLGALHVSKNMNIPFQDLKAKMTGSQPMTLGEAVRALKPNLPEKDRLSEVQKAEKQAQATAGTT